MSYRYPPLATWQAFEVFCRDFFEIRWDAQMMTVVGRQGQSQDGVDVLAMLPGMRWRGIQCKQKADGQLTRAEMKTELEATAGLNVSLERYVFATTAPRDAQVQAWARELAETVDFGIEVVAWHDVCDALADVRYRDVVAKHFPHTHLVAPVPTPSEPAEALDAFRSQHLGAILRLPTLAHAPGQRNADLVLTDVYTALDVTAKVDVTRESVYGNPLSHPLPAARQTSLPGSPSYLERLVASEWAKLSESGYPKSRQRRCRAVEAAAANRHLVLVGAPGSGKSTFGRFLVACLLGESLGRSDIDLSTLEGELEGEFRPWPFGAPLAIFASLQHFQASDHFPADGELGEARHLVDYLVSLGPDSDVLRRGLHRALAETEGALIVLDGLDETPSAEASRGQLKGVLSGLVRAYPGSRVLVTSRPYAYQHESPWRLDDVGFTSVELAPFDQRQQHDFVDAWYRRLVFRRLLDVAEDRQQAMSADLKQQIAVTDYLQPLAQRPLMLTMMADVHASNSGRLPAGGRAALYRKSIDLLLDRWNETRDGTKPTEALGMTLEQIQEALQKLAFEVHRTRGASEAQTVEIRRSELWEALVDTRKAYDSEATADDEQILNYLHQRSGILVGESEKIFRFPHRSYQEYLAASHLVETDDDFPNRLDEVVSEDPSLWREVVLLAAGQTARQKSLAWAIIEMLVPDGVPAEVAPFDHPRGFRALLAGLAIREARLWQAVSTANRGKLERVRLWLRRLIEQGGLDVKDRALAGQVLALLGDDRRGVGLGLDGLPELEWVEIPAGVFWMGGEQRGEGKPRHEAKVERFWISLYPVTHLQYQAFEEDGGHTERWRNCWTEAGWKWKEKWLSSEEELGFPFDLPNHPRVRVSWYQAVAFCNWLSDRTGHTIRLPTEAEWERAARGIDGQAYPWGEKFDSQRCNSFETGLGSTCAVGLFPAGASPPGAAGRGIVDSSGNVLEWCSTKGRGNYEQPAEEDLEGDAVRVSRGGSFADGQVSARSAYRRWGVPGFRSVGIGFRLVVPF